jgi:hypothetical protein
MPRLFIDLPVELRVDIYKQLFDKTTVEVLALGSDASEALKFNTYDQRSAILITCRTCYNEARPILFNKAICGMKIREWSHLLESPDLTTKLFFTEVRYLRLYWKWSMLELAVLTANLLPALEVLDAKLDMVVGAEWFKKSDDEEFCKVFVNDCIEIKPFGYDWLETVRRLGLKLMVEVYCPSDENNVLHYQGVGDDHSVFGSETDDNSLIELPCRS